ncbi:hypothetical protein [Streptomyces lincolnensis]|uniref:hypothetical protein n=1 Tax=Streptomyces lincolnensis TaxID=1915 RepID=UPI0037D8B14D
MIDQMLLADLDAPRKQRHTVVRIYRRLINEHAMDDVSYQVVRACVAKGKPEIGVEAGRGPAQVFTPPALRSIAHVTGSPPLNSSTSLISLSNAFSSLTSRCDSSRVPSAPSTTQWVVAG